MRMLTLLSLVVLTGGCARDCSYEVARLIGTLKDAKPGVRYSATKHLRKYGPKAKEAVQALIEAMNDEDKDVRIGAIYALTEIGPAARDAIPALTGVLKDKS